MRYRYTGLAAALGALLLVTGTLRAQGETQYEVFSVAAFRGSSKQLLDDGELPSPDGQSLDWLIEGYARLEECLPKANRYERYWCKVVRVGRIDETCAAHVEMRCTVDGKLKFSGLCRDFPLSQVPVSAYLTDQINPDTVPLREQYLDRFHIDSRLRVKGLRFVGSVGQFLDLPGCEGSQSTEVAAVSEKVSYKMRPVPGSEPLLACEQQKRRDLDACALRVQALDQESCTAEARFNCGDRVVSCSNFPMDQVYPQAVPRMKGQVALISTNGPVYRFKDLIDTPLSQADQLFDPEVDLTLAAYLYASDICHTDAPDETPNVAMSLELEPAAPDPKATPDPPPGPPRQMSQGAIEHTPPDCDPIVDEPPVLRLAESFVASDQHYRSQLGGFPPDCMNQDKYISPRIYKVSGRELVVNGPTWTYQCPALTSEMKASLRKYTRASYNGALLLSHALKECGRSPGNLWEHVSRERPNLVAPTQSQEIPRLRVYNFYQPGDGQHRLKGPGRDNVFDLNAALEIPIELCLPPVPEQSGRYWKPRTSIWIAHCGGEVPEVVNQCWDPVKDREPVFYDVSRGWGELDDALADLSLADSKIADIWSLADRDNASTSLRVDPEHLQLEFPALNERLLSTQQGLGGGECVVTAETLGLDESLFDYLEHNLILPPNSEPEKQESVLQQLVLELQDDGDAITLQEISWLSKELQ